MQTSSKGRGEKRGREKEGGKRGELID